MFVAKFPFDSLSLMSDFTTVSSIMSIYVGSFSDATVTLTGQDDIVADYTSSVTVHDVTYRASRILELNAVVLKYN